jgi:hypothetical protein
MLLHPPNDVRTESYGERRFDKAAPTLWNSLPLSLRNVNSLDVSDHRIWKEKINTLHLDHYIILQVFVLLQVQICIQFPVNLVLRRCKSEGKTWTAKDVLNPSTVNEMVKLDEGYFILRTLRNSPAYLEKRKKDVFAMIRQFDHFSRQF